MPPKLLIISLLAAALLLIPAFAFLSSSFDTSAEHNALWASGSVGHGGAVGVSAELMAQAEAQARGEGTVADLLLKGGVIMPRLGNATGK